MKAVITIGSTNDIWLENFQGQPLNIVRPQREIYKERHRETEILWEKKSGGERGIKGKS